MRKVFSFILLLSAVCSAQSTVDGFQGLVHYADGTTAPVLSGNPLAVAGTVSQTGTVKTFTPTVSGATSGTCALGFTAVTFSGKRFCPGEPMVVSGSSTAMDYTYSSSGTTAGMDVIASMTTTVITLTAASAFSSGALAATIADGHDYIATTILGSINRTGFVSPLNHIFFYNSVGAATISANAVGKSGSSCNAYADTMAELIVQGFSGPGMDSDGGYDPSSAGSCASNARHPYMYEVVGFSGYFMANLGSYMAQAGKDMNAGTDSSYGCPLKRAQADYFDPNFPTFATGYLNGGSNGSDFTSVNRWKSPYNVAVMFDDTGVYNMMFNSGDVFPTLPRGHTDCNGAMLVMATSPIQAFNNTNPYNSQAEVYIDPLVYSKALSASPPATCSLTVQCSWPDYVRFVYSTIGAVNTAWGSTYTTLGSSGLCVGYSYGWCGSTTTTETLGTGDGSTTVFPFTLAHHTSVSIHSIQIFVNSQAKGGDRGTSGTIGGTGISSGNINYSTGVGSMTFATAVPNGQLIQAKYIQNGWGLGSGLMDEDGRNSWWGPGSAGSYTVTTITPACQRNHAYTVDQICIDATSVSQQIATNLGTTGGSAPTFSSNAGTPTTDGTVIWSSEGKPLAGTGGDYAASTVNPQAAADANIWLGEFGGKFLSTTRTSLLTLFPGSLDQCTDEMGVAYSPARQPLLQAAQQYCDVIFTQLLGTFSDGNALDKLRFTTQTYTGPINNYQNFSTQQSPNPCTPGAPSCVPTQANRGQAWFSLETLATSQTTFNGTYQITGEEWWATGDPFQGISWGLQTQPLGNFFDGHEDVTAVVPCSPPNAAFNCGGEGLAAWNGSNAIYGAGMIQAGNLLWQVAPTVTVGGYALGQFGVSGSFQIGGSGPASCGPPTYPCSRTDLNIAPVGGLISVPPQMGPNTCLSGSLITCGNLSGVNTIITDPDFGNPIARMTDFNSHPAHNTMQTSDSPETQIWNCTGTPACGGVGPTYIVLKATGGVKFVYQFDPTTMLTSTTGVSLGTLGGTISPAWARLSPYRMFGLQGTQVSRYDFVPGTLTFTKTLLFDANQSTCLANPINGASPYNVTSEGVLQPAADDNSFGIEFSNAGGQDTAIHYAFYTVSTGDCWVVNTSAGNVTHNGVLVGSLTTGAGTFTMHEAHTAQSANYALLTPASCLVGPCSVGNTRYQNLTLSLVGCPLTTTCTGEGAAGFTEYLSGNGSGNWHIRPFNDFQNLTLLWITNPALIPPTLNVCNETQHASWNADSGADAEAIIASYGGPGPHGVSCSPFVSAWTNEIIGLFSGTTPIRRFAHNFSSGFNVQFDPAFALGQTSQDGRFLAFSSDWLGTLGSIPPADTTTCVLATTCRADVFVVKLQ